MIGSEKPTREPLRVERVAPPPAMLPTSERGIRALKSRGPWTTKAGGKLSVGLAFGLFSTPFFRLFENYDSHELAKISVDIRGFRLYLNGDMPIAKGVFGGTEFHRIREEIVICTHGRIYWECEDVWGAKKAFILTTGSGIWMPPFILHTYQVEEEGSALIVIANTLFDADRKETHDTFGLETFRELQRHYS